MSTSLRSPSPARRSGPCPLQVFLTCFLSRGLFELPVPELVIAYLEAFKTLGHSVQEAWRCLGVVEAEQVLDLLPGPVEVGEELCPKRVDLGERGLRFEGESGFLS